jgi:hypothetical protein
MQVQIDLGALARPLSDTLWEKLNARWLTGSDVGVGAERVIRLDAGSLRRLASFEREMRRSARRLVLRGAPESAGHAARLMALAEALAPAPADSPRAVRS